MKEHEVVIEVRASKALSTDGMPILIDGNRLSSMNLMESITLARALAADPVRPKKSFD